MPRDMAGVLGERSIAQRVRSLLLSLIFEYLHEIADSIRVGQSSPIAGVNF